jgi:hypothetical protein
MTGADAQPQETIQTSVDKLVWTVRLWEKAPSKRYVVLAAALGAGAVGVLWLQQPIFGFIGIGAILGSTTEFWLPIRYVLDEKGASMRCGISVSAIEWSDVRRVLVTDEAVKLSPLESESKLSPFRGVTLRFGDRRDDVLEYVESRVGEECSISGMKS